MTVPEIFAASFRVGTVVSPAGHTARHAGIPALRCKERRRENPGSAADDHTENRDHGKGEEWVRCAACGYTIARRADRAEVGGGHRHVFANPAGLVYEVLCYKHASGTFVMGTPTTDFSWFPGHAWQAAGCISCRVQLGWRFSGESEFTAFIGTMVRP